MRLYLRKEYNTEKLLTLGFKKSKISANSWEEFFYSKSLAIPGKGYYMIEISDLAGRGRYLVEVTNTTGDICDQGTHKEYGEKAVSILKEAGILANELEVKQ